MIWKIMGQPIDNRGLVYRHILVLVGCVAFVTALLLATPSRAQTGQGGLLGPEHAASQRDVPACSCYRVDAILIEGLLRTRRSVVERELFFVEGEVATVDQVEESIQRLRNTGLFRLVEYELV